MLIAALIMVWALTIYMGRLIPSNSGNLQEANWHDASVLDSSTELCPSKLSTDSAFGHEPWNTYQQSFFQLGRARRFKMRQAGPPPGNRPHCCPTMPVVEGDLRYAVCPRLLKGR